MPAQTRTLVIMAKAPRAGMVKTRLAESLPSSAVTALYCCLLEDTVALAKSLSDVRIAVMCPEADEYELADFLDRGIPVVAQKGEGLAAGLASVFAHFTAAVPQRVIAFNSDSPHLAPSVLDNAFDSLATHDVVIGPTHDGGYYLVGAKASHPALFAGDGMGTRSALDRLISRARALQLSTAFTDLFYDVDVADDLIRLGRELEIAPQRAPRTAAWFEKWKQAIAHLKPPTGDL